MFLLVLVKDKYVNLLVALEGRSVTPQSWLLKIRNVCRKCLIWTKKLVWMKMDVYKIYIYLYLTRSIIKDKFLLSWRPGNI